MPVFTLQKAHARVHVSPRIITVACFLVQHSPILGHAASSHTVARFNLRISARVSAKPTDVGALTRNQSGLRGRSDFIAAVIAVQIAKQTLLANQRAVVIQAAMIFDTLNSPVILFFALGFLAAIRIKGEVQIVRGERF